MWGDLMGEKSDLNALIANEDFLGSISPQLGEVAWHSSNWDPDLLNVSQKHASVIQELGELVATEASRKFRARELRVLEIGSYVHFSGALLEGVHYVAHDISPDALRAGKKAAISCGLTRDWTRVAGDFHDLPFEEGWFDIVFVASSVHHTWRPWRVLDELFRVTRPGGVVHIHNEPVRRLSCMYLFRSSRAESRRPFEVALEHEGLTRTVSSPFPGSRPEKLFGMIENDRIPLSVFSRFQERFAPIRFHAEQGGLIGEFEQWMLDAPRDENLPECLAHELRRRLLPAQAADSDAKAPTIPGNQRPAIPIN